MPPAARIRDETYLAPTGAAPVATAEFAAAMASFMPFESNPALAVAVSGGRDSMALALLAADWVGEAGGTLTALTVDHGLRPEAVAEARQVGDWLRARGISHVTLTWRGHRPRSRIQAAARAARYLLIEDYCAAHGILHVLLGHQRDDQRETVRMRAARQSSGGGLAGMSAIRETMQVRLLRPLLAFSRRRLAATLAARGQAWIDDPSNENLAYERARVRAAATHLAAADIAVADRRRHAAAATRHAAETVVSAAASRCVALMPQGYARIDAVAFTALARQVRLDLLARCVTTVGGRSYPPHGARLGRLVEALAAGNLGRGRTLAGCRILPAPGARGAAWLVVGETPRDAGGVPLLPGARLVWDGRFDVRTPASLSAGLVIGALGTDGWRQIAADAAPPATLPAAARTALPALWRDGMVYAAPHVGFGGMPGLALTFAPVRALSDAGFAKNCENPHP
jgi:tRNA(Ile)-lysidine synthase